MEHQWQRNRFCRVCGLSRNSQSVRLNGVCAGVRVVSPGDPYPSEYVTVTQMRQAGRKFGDHQKEHPVLAVALPYWPYYEYVYDITATRIKHEVTPEQREHIRRTCRWCGEEMSHPVKNRLCPLCQYVADLPIPKGNSQRVPFSYQRKILPHE